MPKTKIATQVTYLQMLAPFPATLPTPPEEGIRVELAPYPTLSFYRSLYSGVGKDYQWSARLLMADPELRKILEDRRVEVHVLYSRNQPAGYIELDGRVIGEVELAYFGLFPEFHGRKLGTYLLQWAVATLAKRPDLERIWVHTCSLDHPSALATYKKVGFVPYLQKEERVDPMPLMPD
jgi:GNAT superfamily N-acetyltransferase